jgi:hypothetical protein
VSEEQERVQKFDGLPFLLRFAALFPFPSFVVGLDPYM